MTPAARVQATLDLLCDVERDPRPVDAVTSGFFRANRSLSEADKGVVVDLLYALLRHRARLGWWAGRAGRADSPRTRMMAWLALGEKRTVEEVARLFPGDRALDDAEAALVRGLRGGTLDHPDMPMDLRLECPAWAAGPLRRRFGPDFATEMSATLAPPPLDLRVNPVKADRATVMHQLRGLGLRAEAMTFSPGGIRVRERVSLARLPGLKAGEIEIQDEGSQMVAHLVDARPGERVVDFCAGAGGKTLAIAAGMMNRGHVVACDVNAARLKRCAERLRRAGLHNAETRVLASESDRWIKRHKGGFDRVLVDAPCSGTGTWRRNPDARWRAPDAGLANLMALQARILASAARLVRPGGRLVYATCSFLCEENEEQVGVFLSAHPEFALVPLAEVAPQVANSANRDCLSLTPARHGTDGFFAAVLRRAP